MDPSALSTENIIGTGLAGIAIAVIAIRKYLQERRNPTTQTGDRIVPGVSIADMSPFRDIAVAQERTAIANERIAVAIEGVFAIMRKRQVDEDEAEVDELRERIRDLERERDRSAGPRKPPARRRRS